MIVFDLECLNGHVFEGWFEDKDDLETQQAQGLLTCPVCETNSVVQKQHRIAIKRSSHNVANNALQARQEAIAELSEKVAEYVEKNFEDVGAGFTKQALKMHYGAEAYRNIKGTTTKEEDKILAKEGVPVFRIPVVKNPKDDLN